MDAKHRDIIEEYRNLISKNLILSDEFYRVLVTHGVFTEGLIQDVKKAPRGQSQSQLLDFLLTRNNAGFGKFCDVLEVTGHRFLSDCLREAENVESTSELDVEDFVKKLPFVSKSIKNDQQKLAVQRYFKDKIHNEVVKQTWRGDISTKERLMMARQQNIEQIWHHEEESKIKDKGMGELQADYLKLQTRADDLRREIKSLHKHIEDMARKHKEALNTQIKFNMANDRHLVRLNDKAEDAGSYLTVIHEEIRSLLGEDYYERPARTDYQNLEENFHKTMKRYGDLKALSQRFREEREYISNQVAGLTVGDEASLKPHFQEFIVKNEESKAQLEQNIQELTAALEKQQKRVEELSWVQEELDKKKKEGEGRFNENYSQLQKQVASTEMKLHARDERIKVLEGDVNSLTQKLEDLEKRLAESKENERRARQLANHTIPKSPPPKPTSSHQQKPINSHYKKPTATRSTGVFVMDNGNAGNSSLEAIKGFGFAGGETLPTGVRSQGSVQAAMKQAAVNGSTNRAQKMAVNRPTRKF